jgi:hypothetical protein
MGKLRSRIGNVKSAALDLTLSSWLLRQEDNSGMISVRVREGGSLGIESVEEIIAGVKDFKETQKRWSKFLGADAETAHGFWEIADGPVVHLVSDAENAIQSLVLKVSSLKSRP